jgi:hypothetical protein
MPEFIAASQIRCQLIRTEEERFALPLAGESRTPATTSLLLTILIMVIMVEAKGLVEARVLSLSRF